MARSVYTVSLLTVVGWLCSRAAGATVLMPYAQCGGQSGVCGTPGFGPCEDGAWADFECPSAYACTRTNEWHYMCTPAATASPALENSTSLTPSVVQPWGQCGGKSGNCGQPGSGPCEDAVWTSYVCPTPFTCNRTNEWFWMCWPVEEESSTAELSEVMEASPVTSPFPAAMPPSPSPLPSMSPVEQSPKPLPNSLAQWEQCGGKSGRCAEFGMAACVDAAWSADICAPNLTCTRDTEWHWMCMPPISRRML